MRKSGCSGIPGDAEADAEGLLGASRGSTGEGSGNGARPLPEKMIFSLGMTCFVEFCETFHKKIWDGTICISFRQSIYSKELVSLFTAMFTVALCKGATTGGSVGSGPPPPKKKIKIGRTTPTFL